jgi:hypothetical protein
MVKISKTEVKEITDQIVNFVEHNPNSTITDIANGLGLKSRNVSRYLLGRKDARSFKGLVEVGKVSSTVDVTEFCYSFKISDDEFNNYLVSLDTDEKDELLGICEYVDLQALELELATEV